MVSGLEELYENDEDYEYGFGPSRAGNKENDQFESNHNQSIQNKNANQFG